MKAGHPHPVPIAVVTVTPPPPRVPAIATVQYSATVV